MKRSTLLMLLLVGGLLLPAGVSAGDDELPRPDSPRLLATGDSVSLAFSLPAAPRPTRVVVLRAVKNVGGFVQVAELDAAQLSWVDHDVEPGAVYWYTIRTRRGARESQPSPRAEATIAGASRLTLLGGSLERALFEVVLYIEGKRYAAGFVHKPGESIGDLAWVEERRAVEDFRLGPRLAGLELVESETHQVQREKLLAPDGQTLTDLAGRELELEFPVPAGRHEVLRARLIDAQGRESILEEGQSSVIR